MRGLEIREEIAEKERDEVFNKERPLILRLTWRKKLTVERNVYTNNSEGAGHNSGAANNSEGAAQNIDAANNLRSCPQLRW